VTESPGRGLHGAQHGDLSVANEPELCYFNEIRHTEMRRCAYQMQCTGRGGSGMRISRHNHQLTNVPQRETPNRGGIIEPWYLVFHFTAGESFQSAVDWFCNPESQASAHLVIGRDGRISQLAPFNVRTWHAGRSHWEGVSGLNQCSIGIEMVNAGRLSKVGNRFVSWFNVEYPEHEVVKAEHKFEKSVSYWHSYTEVQMERAAELAELLVNTYNLRGVVGHDDIAPGRKYDPGPAFPMERIRARIFSTQEHPEKTLDNAGASSDGTEAATWEQDMTSSPLMMGMQLSIPEAADRKQSAGTGKRERGNLMDWIRAGRRVFGRQ